MHHVWPYMVWELGWAMHHVWFAWLEDSLGNVLCTLVLRSLLHRFNQYVPCIDGGWGKV